MYLDPAVGEREWAAVAKRESSISSNLSAKRLRVDEIELGHVTRRPIKSDEPHPLADRGVRQAAQHVPRNAP
jgi:hypothetical protein